MHLTLSFCTSYLFFFHSDSGDSLFLTQSEISASRTVKRHHPSNTPACPFSQESEDERERDSDSNAQHEDTRPKGDSDRGASYAGLLRGWKLLAKTHGRIDRPPRPRPRHQKAPRKRMVLPFLNSGSGQHSAHKRQIIVVRMCTWQKSMNMKVVLKIIKQLAKVFEYEFQNYWIDVN